MAEDTIRISGAEAVLKSLIAEGVDTLFGYPGGAIMPIYDKLVDYGDKLKHFLTRHEQGAVHAAQGYARVTNKVGVCFATSGPGATNLVTGIADAMLDSTPMVAVTAQVASPMLGTDAFQEIDVIGVTMPITKWNYQITSVEEIPEVIAKAFYIARSGRPGPVVVDITKDAQIALLDYKYEKCTKIRSYHPYPKIDMDIVREAAILIDGAKKPMILAGHGILLSDARKEFEEFVNKTQIPTACTILGMGAISQDNPNYVGMLGMHGNYGPNIKTNEADVILAIGMRFDDRVTGDSSRYAKQAKIIHVEIDRSEIGKIIKPEIGINADAKQALNALMGVVKDNNHDDWRSGFTEAMEEEKASVINNDISPSQGMIHMSEVVNMVSEKTNGEAVIATDVGQHQMSTSRYYKFKNCAHLVTSGGLGTMGFGLPAAIGAKVGAPDKQTVLFVGDGGFQMTLQELGTIQQDNIPVKMIILNNHYLGMVRQWQERFFEKRYSFVDMITPDFVKIAESYYIKGEKVDEREQLADAVDRMLASEESYLLEINVKKEGKILPMIEPGASVSEIKLK